MRTYDIRRSRIGARIPRIQINHFALHPRAIGQAQFQAGYAQKPVRRRVDHRHKRHQMMQTIDAKDGKRFARHIRKGQTARFDNGANVVAFALQFRFQLLGGAVLGHLLQAGAGLATVRPKSVNLSSNQICGTVSARRQLFVPIIPGVRRPNYVAESRQPVVRWEILWMRVPRPQALERQLVLGLGTCTALGQRPGQRIVDGLLVLAELLGQRPIVHVPDVSVLDDGRPKCHTAAARFGSGPKYLHFALRRGRCVRHHIGACDFRERLALA